MKPQKEVKKASVTVLFRRGMVRVVKNKNFQTVDN